MNTQVFQTKAPAILQLQQKSEQRFFSKKPPIHVAGNSVWFLAKIWGARKKAALFSVGQKYKLLTPPGCTKGRQVVEKNMMDFRPHVIYR